MDLNFLLKKRHKGEAGTGTVKALCLFGPSGHSRCSASELFTKSSGNEINYSVLLSVLFLPHFPLHLMM